MKSQSLVQYLLDMFSQYGELQPISGWDRLPVLVTPPNLNEFRVLASLVHRRRSTDVNQTLHDVWLSPGLVHYIHFRGLLPPSGILPGAKFTLRLCQSLAFSYIGSVTARHSSSGPQPNFKAFIRRRHLYSAGRPSGWASAHILVWHNFIDCYTTASA